MSFEKKLHLFSLILLAFALSPLIYFTVKQKKPPSNVKIKSSKRQTVKQFVLTFEKSGKVFWELESPSAVSYGKTIKLLKPKLYVNSTTIEASSAVFFSKSKQVRLKGVKLTSKGFRAFSKEGIFFGKNSTFRTEKGCEIKFKNGMFVNARVCLLDVSSGIMKFYKVKTTVRR